MTNPVVHFEIIGTDPGRLQNYYGDLVVAQFTDPNGNLIGLAGTA